MIDSIPEKELRNFVLNEARSNPAFRENLEMEILHQFPEEMMDSFYSAVDAMAGSAQNVYGYIPAANAGAFESSILSYLKTRVSMLLKNGFAEQAANLVSYAVEALSSLNADFTLEEEEELWSQMKELVVRCFRKDTRDLEEDHFAWLEMQLEKLEASPAFEKSMEDAAVELYSEPWHMRRILERLSRKLEKEKSVSSRLRQTERCQDLIAKCWQLVSGSDELLQEKESFLRSYGDDSYVEKMLIEEAVKERDLETAEQILEKSLEKAGSGTLESAMKTRQLAGLLLGQNRQEEAVSLLKKLSESRHCNSQDLIQLSALLPVEEFEPVLAQARKNGNPLVIAQTLEKLGRGPELMDFLEETDDALLAELFEESLIKEEPGRLADLWIRQAEKEADQKEVRNYENAAEALKRASRIPSGRKKAEEAAAKIKEKYPRKKGLIHRIVQSGFPDESPADRESQKKEQD